MARLLKSLRNFLGSSPSSSPTPLPSRPPLSPSTASARSRFPRSIDTDFSVFREGDRVVINNVKRRQPILTAPLRRGHKIDTPRGILDPDRIIGRGPREIIPTHKGTRFLVTLPTLEQYISMTPRHVTPIYAKDASVIVSLLDLHVAQPGEDDHTDGPAPLQILESGTGHGALTLHLSRAIQAANTLPSSLPKASQVKYLEQLPEEPKDAEEDGEQDQAELQQQEQEQEQWDAWRATRKAIIHTVEVSPIFSRHAEKLIRGFRRGIYAGNIDFYVGRVENWVSDQIKKNSSQSQPFQPFLTHAILDMPSAHLRIPHVASVLKPHGILAVFMPSVTQITECAMYIRKQGIPLELDKVVELGTGISGGRTWDVRFAVKKSKADPGWDSANGPSGSEAVVEESGSESVGGEGEGPAQAGPVANAKEEPVLVCRPLAGQLIGAGGFVGIWRKLHIPSSSGV
ncbi:S-adenosyl-L-methionine-dependent methyltransferase [Aspergillus falconensis]